LHLAKVCLLRTESEQKEETIVKNTLLALALAAMPLAGHAADELSYNYAEVDYLNLDHGADGAALRGSVGIGKTGIYAFGQVGHTDLGDAGDGNVTSNEVGVGYHHAVAAKTDLIGEIAYRNADADHANIDGARGSFGVRSALGDRVEGFVKANYYDASDYHGDVTGTVGGQFKFGKTWGATAEAEVGNGDQAWLLGVRASF